MRKHAGSMILSSALVLAGCAAYGPESSVGGAPLVNASFADEMVTAHNYWRAQVGQPPVRWSQTVGNHAQDWAETLAERGVLEHQLKDHYGENLALFKGRSPDPREVVDYWASEQRNYDERNNSCRGECRHYTQIVWGTTKEVGCGTAERNGITYWVCNYLPAGNAHGVKPY